MPLSVALILLVRALGVEGGGPAAAPALVAPGRCYSRTVARQRLEGVPAPGRGEGSYLGWQITIVPTTCAQAGPSVLQRGTTQLLHRQGLEPVTWCKIDTMIQLKGRGRRIKREAPLRRVF